MFTHFLLKQDDTKDGAGQAKIRDYVNLTT